MPTANERMHVLQMIADKQITAEQGAQLLAALHAGSAAAENVPNAARWLRVRVTDALTGKPKANVTIPIGLVEVGLRLGARYMPDKTGLELNAVRAAVRQGLPGKIMEVEDNQENERVEIFVE